MKHRGDPAIDRMTPDERAIFIRCLADIALEYALMTFETERTTPSIDNACRDIVAEREDRGFGKAM